MFIQKLFSRQIYSYLLGIYKFVLWMLKNIRYMHIHKTNFQSYDILFKIEGNIQKWFWEFLFLSAAVTSFNNNFTNDWHHFTLTILEYLLILLFFRKVLIYINLNLGCHNFGQPPLFWKFIESVKSLNMY